MLSIIENYSDYQISEIWAVSQRTKSSPRKIEWLKYALNEKITGNVVWDE